MNKKGSLHVLIFILIFFVFTLSVSIIDISPLISLFLVSLAYSLFHFISAFQNSKFSTNSLIICILLVLITIKIEYHYYNIFLHFLILTISFYFLKPFKKLKANPKKTIGLCFIVFNFTLLLTPDDYVFNSFNKDKILWTPDLEWSDFKGEVIDSSKADAQIYSRTTYKLNKVYNYPNVVTKLYMNPNKSWKREISDTFTNRHLLNHEQGHFNISEAFRRFMKDSLKETWGQSTDKNKKVIDYFMNKRDRVSFLYDSITKHGSFLKAQKKWDSQIDEWLE